jgi:SAM-dependent methyltransferase
MTQTGVAQIYRAGRTLKHLWETSVSVLALLPDMLIARARGGRPEFARDWLRPRSGMELARLYAPLYFLNLMHGYLSGGRFVFRSTERLAEFSFALRNTEASESILDVGSGDSVLPFQLASSGNDVTTLDVRSYPLRHPHLRSIVGDAMHLPFRDSTFDCTTCISTLEHVGLGYYGDPIDDAGWMRCASEMIRVLKPGGRLLLTVPFGIPGRNRLQRSFTREMLEQLSGLATLGRIEFYASLGNVWVPVEYDAAANADSLSFRTSAVACCLLLKR